LWRARLPPFELTDHCREWPQPLAPPSTRRRSEGLATELGTFGLPLCCQPLA
jgi:hypothetical protein